MASSLDNPRDQTQAKVFTRWVNLHLQKAREPFTVNDLGTDLVSGEALILLSEVFVKGNPTKYSKAPKNQLQRTQNHSSAISRLEGDYLQLVNIHASTLANEEQNNIKIFMGYIFQLILKYSVGDINDELDADAKKKQQSLTQLKQALIDWVNKQLDSLSASQNAAVRKFNNAGDSDEPLHVNNLEGDWTDGTILAGLAISLHPEDKREHGLEKLNELAQQSGGDNAALSASISRSNTNLSVPPLMEASEMANSPDQNSILTYVSAFKNAKYVDDAPVIEHAKIEWDEAAFLKLEVDALSQRDVSQIEEQKAIIASKLEEYNANKAEGKVYEPSCDRLAVRLAYHLARITAIIDNDAADKNASNSKADENAAVVAQKDEEIAAANKDLDEEKKKNKKLQDDLDAANNDLDEEKKKSKKLQDDLDAANQELDEERKKNKKLQDDLEASQAALAKLQKRHTRLGELQVALLACAAISDEMMADEETQ